MTRRIAVGSTLVTLCLAAASHGQAIERSAPVMFSLPNGLSVVIDEDPTVANVAVELWVRAGSRYETDQHFGQAHFFEHMFGATRLPAAPGRVLGGNAQTRRDFCRYYLLVDRQAVEYAIAAQADRLDYPLPAMSAERLAANRDVVMNEFRGYESRPFGFGSITDVKMLMNGFGSRHPYGRPIQLNDDVAKLTDLDMKRWIAEQYRPSGSLLLLAGNVTATNVRPLIDRYFGPIPAVRDEGARPVARISAEPIDPTPERHERIDVSGPAGRVFAAWATPRYGDPDADYLSLFAEVLAAPDVGRLHQQLTVRDRIADSTAADAQLEELAGLIRATVLLVPGADTGRAEAALVKVASELATTGPTESELRVAKARLAARAARQWERLGFQGSRIDLVAEGALYVGDPLMYRKRLDRIAAATPQDVTRVTRTWISRHGYFLTAAPRSAAAAAAQIDRSRPVTLPAAPGLEFPAVIATTLRNGVTLATIDRPRSALVNIAVVMPAFGATERAQRIAADAITDRHPGNESRRANRLRRCIDAGATVDVAVSAGFVTVTIDTLAADGPLGFQAAAAILSDEPIDAGALARARERETSQASTDDTSARMRATLSSALMTGTSAGSAARSPAVVVSGAFGRPALETILGSVTVGRRAPIVDPNSRPAAQRPGLATVYFVDEPGRSQTILVAGEALPSGAASQFVLARLAAAVLSSRMYGNLREQHQWAYEAQAALSSSADGAQIVTIATELQTAHAAEAIAEIRRECDRPVSDAEAGRLAIIRRDLLQQIAGNIDTVAGTTAVVADLARRGLPLTAAGDLMQESVGVDAARMAEALHLVRGAALTFVLGGDAQTVIPQLTAAGIEAVFVAR